MTMKRLLLLLAFLLPSTANAIDWSMDTGYLRWSFTGKEQLGAVSPQQSLHLSSGQGPSVFASTGFHTQWLNFGFRTQAAYLFLSGQPAQPYKVKGKAIDTTSLASPVLVADLTTGFHVGQYKFELGGGFASVGVGQRWAMPFDFDTAAHAAGSVTFAYKGMDVTVTADAMFLPAVTAKDDFTVVYGWNVTFGKAAEVPVFADPVPTPAEPTPVVLPPVLVPVPVDPTPVVLPPADPTPVSLPHASTPVVQPSKPIAASLPAPPTPVAVEGEDPVILFIVQTLRAKPRLFCEIRVQSEDNELAMRRANAARDRVVANGINPTRVWAVLLPNPLKGKGKAQRDIDFAFVSKRPVTK